MRIVDEGAILESKHVSLIKHKGFYMQTNAYAIKLILGCRNFDNFHNVLIKRVNI